MPTYKKNFITEAIIKIDFENTIPALNGPLSKDLDDEIMKYFTLKETRQAFTEKIMISNDTGKIQRDRVAFKEWNYLGNEKLRRFCITQNFLFIAYNKYTNFDDFSVPFLSILSKLSLQFPDLKANKIGMRYINNISFDEPDKLVWNEYLDPRLSNILTFPDNPTKITRAFHVLELYCSEDDFRLKFQYGMHNPDYPSPIKQKLFVLDYDAYRIGLLTTDEAINIIPQCHSKIESTFEKSITQNFRDKLNE